MLMKKKRCNRNSSCGCGVTELAPLKLQEGKSFDTVSVRALWFVSGPGQLRAIRYAIPISWPINGTNGQLPVRAARERRNWTGRPGALLQMDLYDRETHYTRDGITSLPPTMTPLCSTRVSLSLLVVSLLQKIATGGTITCL
ncbi:hypothetical protein J6590_096931 [Homalodisca vitripennis]|nr:hypothetical protein J6590_096931 [Homalodisca vitripennis]